MPSAETPGRRFLHDLNLLVTRTCNAACGHCSVESSPEDRREMSAETLAHSLELIAVFAARPGARRVVLTGGEPFLRRRTLERIAAAAHRAGLLVGVETNGYWATTAERARRVVAGAAIDCYWISSSVFHLRFVPLDRVLHAWAAAREAGRQARVRVAVRRPDGAAPADGAESELLARLESEVGAADLVVVPVSPSGRAAQRRLVPLGRGFGALPAPALCPADGPLVDERGAVHPCCNNVSTLPDHALVAGRLGQGSAAEILARLEDDPLFALLRSEGFQALLERLPAGLRSRWRRRQTPDVCRFCQDLFADPETARRLAAWRDAEGPPAAPAAG